MRRGYYGNIRAEEIIAAVFALGPQVRYVAIASGQEVLTRQRTELAAASESVSDRFEELLVNPGLLTLTRQRGEIDCGGLRYVIVRYGNFLQIVVPRPEGGHISVAVEPGSDPVSIGESVIELIDERHRMMDDGR
jgi:hypothetical protein